MTRFKVDDGMWGHPKFDRVSDSAVALWVRAGSWCCRYLMDGYVPADKLYQLRGSTESASELVSAGLWELASDGYVFHDWGHLQETKEDVEAHRERDRKRKRATRSKSGNKKRNSQQTASARTPSGFLEDSERIPRRVSDRRGEERSVREEREGISSHAYVRSPESELVRLGFQTPANADDAEQEAIRAEASGTWRRP